MVYGSLSITDVIVAKNVVDVTGNGSILQPFSAITLASFSMSACRLMRARTGSMRSARDHFLRQPEVHLVVRVRKRADWLIQILELRVSGIDEEHDRAAVGEGLLRESELVQREVLHLAHRRCRRE